jgi:hypothetical protein
MALRRLLVGGVAGVAVLAALGGQAPAQYPPRGMQTGSGQQYRAGTINPYGAQQPVGAVTPGMTVLDFYRSRLGDRARGMMLPGVGGGIPSVPMPGIGRLGGYPYPLPGGKTPATGDQKPVPAQDQDWPRWLEVPAPGHRPTPGATAAGGALQLAPDQCFVARLAEQVDVRPDGEKAFYPLAFWDQTRLLKPGSSLRILGQGRALLVFQDGTRIDLIRSGELSFSLATNETLRLDLDRVSEAHCRLGSRKVEIRLPGGGSVRGSKCGLFIERVSRLAPWNVTHVEERLFVRNWGPEKVTLDPGFDTAPGGVMELEPNLGSMILLVAGRMAVAKEPAAADERTDPLPQLLPGGGQALRASLEAEIDKSGPTLRARASRGTARLEWGGVRITVPSGGRVVIDPLAGEPFGEGRPTSAEGPPAKETGGQK